MPVDGEAGHADLRVCGVRRCEEHRAGALGPVEAPHCLDGVRILVDYLGDVAPAGCYREGRYDVFSGEFVGAGCAFCDSADGGVRDDALHGFAACVAYFTADELRRRLCHVHGLDFKAFAYSELSSVNDGSDSDF